jgi:peptidoglycan/LPS O-acetylase OafA/YrhL
LIYSFSASDSTTVLSRIFSNKWLVMLGDISFGFYLFQRILFRYFLLFNDRFFHIHNYLVIIVLAFVLIMAISILSYNYFEKSANKFVKKILTKPVAS